MEKTWKQRVFHKQRGGETGRGRERNPIYIFSHFSALSIQMLHFLYQQYSAIFSNIQQYDIACNYRNVQKRKVQLSLKSSSKGLDHNCMQFEVLEQCFYMTCKVSAISEKPWRIRERRYVYKINVSTVTKALFVTRSESNPSVPSAFWFS